MADNLPLIPGKTAACTDVRSVLRTVFRELDYLPPLAVTTASEEKTSTEQTSTLPAVEPWIEKFRTECKELCEHEDEMKLQHARRIMRDPLPNIFKLHPPRPEHDVPDWKLKLGLIERRDLAPTIEQDAGRDGSLWVRNILNASSSVVSAPDVTSAPRDFKSLTLSPPRDASVQSLSVGEVLVQTTGGATPPAAAAGAPDYILCVPRQLHFVDFYVGHMHTQLIRLINISKFECRISVSPPKRRELDIEISGPRGLTVTSGAAAELKVHFRPTDVRALFDCIAVRVSSGQVFNVPVACYMQPPLLDILVPHAPAALLQCRPEASEAWCCRADLVELGARLLGDVHCARLLLQSHAERAVFFVLTEDSWLDWNLDCLTNEGSVVSDPFVVWPAWWRGGGVVRACAWCRAPSVGAHTTLVRILSSTAVTRQLHLLADLLYFKPDHLVIEAHEKDYDICSDDDPACEYYVNIGTAFPHRSLSATVQLVNRSPVLYTYYWSVRPWGVCYCWEEEKQSASSVQPEEDEDRLCSGAIDARRMSRQDPGAYEGRKWCSRLLRVEPAQGQILPRSSCALRVLVPDVGAELGVKRAVLMLILKNIPKESILEAHQPMIIKTEEVESVHIPGVKSYPREVCEVVCAQMEVWWKVAPLRFVLDPPALTLSHSRRVRSVKLSVRAWQLFGTGASRARWEPPSTSDLTSLPALPAPLHLAPAAAAHSRLVLPLPSLPNHYPHTDIFKLVADNDEWQAQISVTRCSDTRHPRLRPARAWLGVVPPAHHLDTRFCLYNDTFQHISFWMEAHRWMGENNPRPACEGRVPCERCRELRCSCALLTPSRGALADGEHAHICYEVNAPERDGCVATLVQGRRCSPDLAQVHDAPATESRAALVMYRVLAPRLLLRLLPCGGEGPDCAVACDLDEGARRSRLGAAVLRPSGALVLGRRTCYRLRLINLTPLPTAVHFDTPIDRTDLLKVKFYPNDFSMNSYGTVEVRVVLEGVAVCARRVFVYRAMVLRAHKPCYLVVDTAVTGLEISCQVPIGGDVNTDDFVIMRRSQRPSSPGDESRRQSVSEIFAEEDRKREFVKADVCSCRTKLVYIPPVKRPMPPLQPEDDIPPPEIVTEPPPMTRVCRCRACTKPLIPDTSDAICLQFVNIPLRKVCERRVVLRNESVVTAHFSCVVRRHPHISRDALHKEQHLEATSPGVGVRVVPAAGVLAARAVSEVRVQVYADCWGLYHDQILIQVDKVEPIVLDVWIQAVGPPLHVKMQDTYKYEEVPTLWMTSSDPARTLRVKNVSRSDLTVHAYVTRENEMIQDVLPFRLYMRMYDVLPRTCRCLTAYEGEMGETSETSVAASDMDTGVELYLGPDHGLQDDLFYKVSPEVRSVAAGECCEWQVRLSAAPYAGRAPDVAVLLRLQPLQPAGDRWYRGEPPPQLVRLRQAARQPHLKVSTEEVIVSICALDLPQGDFLRIRKHFYLQNVGNGNLKLSMHTSLPWCVVRDNEGAKRDPHLCKPNCVCIQAKRDVLVNMELPPRSSTAMCVEVCVSTLEAWPSGALLPAASSSLCPLPSYASRRRNTTPLYLYDDHHVLLTVPLTLDVEFPVVQLEPRAVDFGCVTDGQTRKTYVSVSHTSRTKTLSLKTIWNGREEFELWPPYLEVAPGSTERFYIQYTAVWRHGPAEGFATVRLRGAAAWCGACAAVRAAPARDRKCGAPHHDYTDDTHLLPPHVHRYTQM